MNNRDYLISCLKRYWRAGESAPVSLIAQTQAFGVDVSALEREYKGELSNDDYDDNGEYTYGNN